MPLFDRIAMVDWSAAAVPTTGRDSIWIAEVDGDGPVRTSNPSTRSQAMAQLRAFAGQVGRVLIGFDFAFGYPRGTAEPFGGRWTDVWAWLANEATDADNNANDRFALAGRFNDHFPGDGPLWGHPPGRTINALAPTKPTLVPGMPPAKRGVERIVRNAQPTGKLAYPGSVGSQTLLGIARLERWRRDPELGARTKIWPFETGFGEAFGNGIVIAEIFPSLHPVRAEANEVRDEAQVRTLARGYADLDAGDRLRDHLAGPTDPTVRDLALREEGWIMSVADEPLRLVA